MKPFKLLSACAPIALVASREVAEASTTTVVTPVSTNTHTRIVFVTATAGPTVSTCLASVCEPNSSTGDIISTISLTSFSTSTKTQVVTPPDATTTITKPADMSNTTSCVMRSQSTLTVTVTQTSTPVITKSVYPIPATETKQSEASAPVHPSSISVTTALNSTQLPPYANGTNFNSTVKPTNGPTGYIPLHTDVLGGVPDAGHYAMTALQSTKYPINIVGGSVGTGGSLDSSTAGRVRPPRLFALITKLLSIHSLTGYLSVNARQVDSEYQLGHYAARLVEDGPLPVYYTARRLTITNTTASIVIIGTLRTTSTTTFTVTQQASPISPEKSTLSLVDSNPTPTMPSLLQQPNGSTSDPNQFVTVPSDAPVVVTTPVQSTSNSTGLDTTNLETFAQSWISVQNITVLSTVTAPGSPNTFTHTTTATADSSRTVNVTSIIEDHTTHTRTVSKTLLYSAEQTTSTASDSAQGLTAFAVVAGVVIFILFVASAI